MILASHDCLLHDHVPEGKLRLQAMLREGKHPCQVEKRYSDGSLLRMIFDDGQLAIERWSDAGELLKRDVELIVPAIRSGAKARIH